MEQAAFFQSLKPSWFKLCFRTLNESELLISTDFSEAFILEKKRKENERES